jgi:hypothetical protein
MALEIGSGITIGGGISLATESGGGSGGSGFINSSFLAEMIIDKNTFYGTKSTELNAYGIEGLVWSPDSGYTSLLLIDGTYSGYTIEQNYPYRSAIYIGGVRATSLNVTVGGVTVNMPFNDFYQSLNDVFDLTNKVGQTLSISIAV